MERVERLVRLLHDGGVVKFGTFKLSSGRTSNYYVDMRECLSSPQLYMEVVELYVELLSNLEHDVIAGVATGGIPWASMIAYKTGKPLAYVRVEKKAHGTMGIVEGARPEGRIVVVVDDVATTGGSIERAVGALRDGGAIVKDAVVAVDREEGASERLERLGVKLHSILSASQILRLKRTE